MPPGEPPIGAIDRITRDDIPAITPESEALAKALKKRGFRFLGPTTAYAHMQAVGVVNDHVAGCSSGN
jgi:DNA-3-methyladenine glycosylase I